MLRRLLPFLLLPILTACISGPQTPQEVVSALSAAVGGSSGGRCLPFQNAYSEQVIRLHTQMMVTGLTCAEAFGQPDLQNQYRQFTADHADTIREAERLTLIRLGGNVSDFDRYRTEIANGEALMVTDLGSFRYCQARRPRFDTMLGRARTTFPAYASALTHRQLAAVPGCDASPP